MGGACSLTPSGLGPAALTPWVGTAEHRKPGQCPAGRADPPSPRPGHCDPVATTREFTPGPRDKDRIKAQVTRGGGEAKDPAGVGEGDGAPHAPHEFASCTLCPLPGCSVPAPAITVPAGHDPCRLPSHGPGSACSPVLLGTLHTLSRAAAPRRG